MTKKYVLKGGLPVFRCYSFTLVDRDNLFRPANGMRSMACGAPVRWSKYTTLELTLRSIYQATVSGELGKQG